MAPLNSTLIHENAGSKSDLSRYSPILPLKWEGNHANKIKSICSRTNNIQHETDFEDEEEVPIWICGEPRYITGITSTTTCNDILGALIEDEINNGNLDDVAASRDLNDYVITERWRDVEQALSGDTCILPIWNAWGCNKNEVKLRLKINKGVANKKAGNLKQKEKPKKEKSNFVTKLLNRILKQGEAIHDHLSVMSDKTLDRKGKEKLRKYMKQKYGKKMVLENFLNDVTTASPLFYENKHFSMNRSIIADVPLMESTTIENTDDELLLVIENNCGDSDSGVDACTNHGDVQQVDCESINSCKYKETPKRKYRSKKEYELLRQHTLNKKMLKAFSTKAVPKNEKSSKAQQLGMKAPVRFDMIRFEILTKMNDMNKLLQREVELGARLASKCAKYKTENEIYTTKIGLEMCIEGVQKNLEKYAKEIIYNENELFKTKYEIKQKCRVLDELKKVLCLEETEEDRLTELIGLEDRKKLQINLVKRKMSDIDFVDNIYEFCDNNESMMV